MKTLKATVIVWAKNNVYVYHFKKISACREMSVAELARELDTYGGAVRHRQDKGDAVADGMVEEFVRRVMTALDRPAGESQETKIITKNSFFLVMRRKN